MNSSDWYFIPQDFFVDLSLVSSVERTNETLISFHIKPTERIMTFACETGEQAKGLMQAIEERLRRKEIER